jgi:hypothetical protein
MHMANRVAALQAKVSDAGVRPVVTRIVHFSSIHRPKTSTIDPVYGARNHQRPPGDGPCFSSASAWATLIGLGSLPTYLWPCSGRKTVARLVSVWMIVSGTGAGVFATGLLRCDCRSVVVCVDQLRTTPSCSSVWRLCPGTIGFFLLVVVRWCGVPVPPPACLCVLRCQRLCITCCLHISDTMHLNEILHEILM